MSKKYSDFAASVKAVLLWIGILALISFIIFGFNSCGRAIFEKGVYYGYDAAYDDDLLFHKSTCNHIYLDDEEESGWIIRFDNYAEARESGYTPCPDCLPEAYEEYASAEKTKSNEDYAQDLLDRRLADDDSDAQSEPGEKLRKYIEENYGPLEDEPSGSETQYKSVYDTYKEWMHSDVSDTMTFEEYYKEHGNPDLPPILRNLMDNQ